MLLFLSPLFALSPACRSPKLVTKCPARRNLEKAMAKWIRKKFSRAEAKDELLDRLAAMNDLTVNDIERILNEYGLASAKDSTSEELYIFPAVLPDYPLAGKSYLLLEHEPLARGLSTSLETVEV
jgi:hypothetical protein